LYRYSWEFHLREAAFLQPARLSLVSFRPGLFRLLLDGCAGGVGLAIPLRRSCMSASEGRALMEIGAIRTLSREGYQYYLKVLAGMLGALLVTCSDRAFNSYCMEPRYVAVPISCIGGGAGGTRHGSGGVCNPWLPTHVWYEGYFICLLGLSRHNTTTSARQTTRSFWQQCKRTDLRYNMHQRSARQTARLSWRQ